MTKILRLYMSVILLSLFGFAPVALAQLYVTPEQREELNLNELKQDYGAPYELDQPSVEQAPDAAPSPPSQTIEDYANGYFQNCMKQDHPILKAQDLKQFCSCTSAQIPDVLSAEEFRNSLTDTSEGRFQQQRIKLFVYAPCMAYPARALVLDNCINNAQQIPNATKVCPCLADGIRDYVLVEGGQLIERYTKDPRTKDLDPIAALMNSPHMEMQNKYLTTVCVGKHLR